MKKRLLIVMIALVSAFILSSQEISILSMEGTVQVKENAEAKWIAARKGQALKPGHLFFTGFNSSAVIKAGNANIEVKPMTQASVSSLVSSKENVVTDVYLKYGKLKANVQKVSNVKTDFKIRTANTTASVRGTIFSLTDDSLEVEEGTVYYTTNDNMGLFVQPGEKARYVLFSMIGSPFSEYMDSYGNDTNPIGLSDDEKGRTGFGGKGGTRTRGNVLIKIRVVQ